MGGTISLNKSLLDNLIVALSDGQFTPTEKVEIKDVIRWQRLPSDLLTDEQKRQGVGAATLWLADSITQLQKEIDGFQAKKTRLGLQLAETQPQSCALNRASPICREANETRKTSAQELQKIEHDLLKWEKRLGAAKAIWDTLYEDFGPVTFNYRNGEYKVRTGQTDYGYNYDIYPAFGSISLAPGSLAWKADKSTNPRRSERFFNLSAVLGSL